MGEGPAGGRGVRTSLLPLRSRFETPAPAAKSGGKGLHGKHISGGRYDQLWSHHRQWSASCVHAPCLTDMCDGLQESSAWSVQPKARTDQRPHACCWFLCIINVSITMTALQSICLDAPWRHYVSRCAAHPESPRWLRTMLSIVPLPTICGSDPDRFAPLRSR